MDNFGNSWIKLPRKFTQWRWYKDTNTVKLYIHLLLSANIRDVEYRNRIIKRGELITTLKSLSINNGMSVKNIRTCLNKLEETGEISCMPSSTGTLVILLDFNNFQPVGIDESVEDWVKLYRNMLEWRWYTVPKVCHVMIHIMLKGELTITSNSQEVLCCFQTSRRILSIETGISVRSIRTCLEKLEYTQDIMIDYDFQKQRSIITICPQERNDAKNNHLVGNNKKYKKATKLNYITNSYGSASYPTDEEESGKRTANERHSFKNDQGVTRKSTTKATKLNYITNNYDSASYATDEEESGKRTANERPQKWQTNGKRTANKNKTIRLKDNIIINNARACAREENLFLGDEENESEEKEKTSKETFFENLKKDIKWQRAIMRYFKFNKIENVIEKIDEFDDYITIRGKENHIDMEDLKSHFFDWMKINLKENGIYKRAKRKTNGSVPKSSEGGIYSDPF